MYDDSLTVSQVSVDNKTLLPQYLVTVSLFPKCLVPVSLFHKCLLTVSLFLNCLVNDNRELKVEITNW